jgi:hypothetical protein
MKKYAVQEKSRGVLLFAFNTDIDYIKIAKRATHLIRHTLNLPVTLITDQSISDSQFDHVIVVDNNLQNNYPGKAASWRNGDRFRAYELSPYNETLLIDSDYLMLDQSLLKLFEQDFDYRIMSYNQNLTGDWSESMGPIGLNYQWATAILFRKTLKSKLLFDLVGRIQRNYHYYAKLYHVSMRGFRNDYAFTIANNILNGYCQDLDKGIPWKMLSVSDVVDSVTIKNNLLTLRTQNKAYLIPQQNIHIIDKKYLLTDNFANFVEAICAE